MQVSNTILLIYYVLSIHIVLHTLLYISMVDIMKCYIVIISYRIGCESGHFI